MSTVYVPPPGKRIRTFDPRTGNTATVTVIQILLTSSSIPSLLAKDEEGGNYTLYWSYAKNAWVIYGRTPF